MAFVGVGLRNSRQARRALEMDKGGAVARPRLSMYTVPPSMEISLEEFEKFAIDRVMVLKAIDNALALGKKNDEVSRIIDAACRAHMPFRSDNRVDDARKDEISHFVLRLAYSRTEELRRFFLAAECTLFKHRFVREDPAALLTFLRENDLHYEEVDEEEKSALAQRDGVAGFLQLDVRGTLFKVPFEQALDLVRSRQVYLLNGYAYVHQRNLVSIILSEFRMRLSHALTIAAKALPNIKEDERLLPLLTNMGLHMMADANNEVDITDKITPSMVHTLADQSMPLCMRRMHKSMRSAHLRHEGRLQYGLFLKAIGLSMEDAITFFRREFCRTMGEAEFKKKNYTYNIRYNYGQEGARKDFSSFSCGYIIMHNKPTTEQAHGCPFAHTDESSLMAIMRDGVRAAPEFTSGRSDLKSAEGKMRDAINLAKGHHYQLACGAYFKILHPKTPNDVAFESPKQYYFASREYLKANHSVDTVMTGQDAADDSVDASMTDIEDSIPGPSGETKPTTTTTTTAAATTTTTTTTTSSVSPKTAAAAAEIMADIEDMAIDG